MIQIICDLCGKPLLNKDRPRSFKIKEFKRIRSDHVTWVEIDAHDTCVKKLLRVTKESENGQGLRGDTKEA